MTFSGGGDAAGLYVTLEQAWLRADSALRMSELSLRSRLIQNGIAEADLDPGWKLALGSGQTAGFEARQSGTEEELYLSLVPSVELAFGAGHETSAGLSAQIIADGSTVWSIRPALSLSHRIDDLLDSDRIDPDELSRIISLQNDLLVYQQRVLASKQDMLEQLIDIFESHTAVVSYSFELANLEDELETALGQLGYLPDSSFVRNLEYQISVKLRQRDYSQRLVNQDLEYLELVTGLDLAETDIRPMVQVLARSAPELSALELPSIDEFSSIGLELLNLDLSRARLEDLLEADPAILNLGLSAAGNYSAGSLEAADLGGSLGLKLGETAEASLSLGYSQSSVPAGGDSPYLRLSLAFSGNGRSSLETLEQEQSKLAVETAMLTLERAREQSRFELLTFENQIRQLQDQSKNNHSQRMLLMQELEELRLRVESQVGSADELADIEHQLEQLEDEALLISLQVLMLENSIRSASLALEAGYPDSMQHTQQES